MNVELNRAANDIPRGGICYKSLILTSVVVLAITSLLNLLGVGLGFSILDFHQDQNISAIGFGGYCWVLLVALVALFIGGWLQGAILRSTHTKRNTILHSVGLWAVTGLITLGAVGSGTGMVLSGANSILGRALQATQVIAPQMNDNMPMPKVSFMKMRGEMQEDLNNLNMDQNTAKTLMTDINHYFMEDNEDLKNNMRNKLIQRISNKTGMSPAQASTQLTQWANTYQTIKDKAAEQAKEAANQATNVVAKSFFGLFLINFLSLLTGIAGAIVGFGEDDNRRVTR